MAVVSSRRGFSKDPWMGSAGPCVNCGWSIWPDHEYSCVTHLIKGKIVQKIFQQAPYLPNCL